MLARRSFLSAAALGSAGLMLAPGLALAAAPTDRRFVFIIQRGAADGLAIVAPTAEPAYAGLRGNLASDPAHAAKLDGTFLLHPALARTAAMYRDKQALFVHAVALPYRDRSHFDAQNVLETGGIAPYQRRDGWMNRLIALLPHSKDAAVALAATVPTALRGSVDVASYAPSALPQAPDDLLVRVGRLYDADAQLHPLWRSAMAAREVAGGSGPRQDPTTLGLLAASFLKRPDGARVAMIETGGWDTHSGQAARLATQLGQLDLLLAALRDGLGPAWTQTTVLVATEFGRTAAVNGTGGTDHGTGSVAMLVGGAVRGGRVIADWPGLASANLYEGRDLKPTMALDSLIAAAAGEALGLEPARVAQQVFAQKAPDKAMEGLTA